MDEKEEEVKPREVRPYQRIMMREELREALGHPDLTQAPKEFFDSLSSKPPSPINIQIASAFEGKFKDNNHISFVCENPRFNIREEDKSDRGKQIPGYLRVNYVFNPETQKLEMDSLECSNAEIYDAVFNPEKFTATTVAAQQPTFAEISSEETSELVKEMQSRKNKRFEDLLHNMETEKIGDAIPFDRDKNGSIQTYGSSAFEEKARAYYVPEMLSLCNIATDSQMFLDQKRKPVLSQKNLSIAAQHNVFVNEHEKSLNVELTHLNLIYTDPKTSETTVFALTGKLILKYHLDEEEGFRLSGAKSDNPELIKFFKYLFLAPQQLTSEKCRELQLNSFIEEPTKVISSEAEFLSLLTGIIKEELTEILSKSTTADPSRTAWEKDKARYIEYIEPGIDETQLKGFFRQELISLIPRISTEPFTLMGSSTKKEKPTRIYTENGTIFMTTELPNPRYVVRSPYDSNADPIDCTIQGNIRITYAFDHRNGFTLADVSLSTNILYNLTFNSHKLFPQGDQPPNAKHHEQFVALVSNLQAKAAEQEANHQPQQTTAAHSAQSRHSPH